MQNITDKGSCSKEARSVQLESLQNITDKGSCSKEARSVQLESLHTDKGSCSEEKCEIDKNRMCIVHDCGTRTVKITSKKWMLNKKTGLYGSRSVKVSKLICVAKNGGLESPRKSTPPRARVGIKNVVGKTIGMFEQLESSSKAPV